MAGTMDEECNNVREKVERGRKNSAGQRRREVKQNE